MDRLPAWRAIAPPSFSIGCASKSNRKPRRSAF